MPDAYIVTVVRRRTVEKLVRGEWTTVRTEAEAARGKGIDGEGGVYGYAPDRVREVTETDELFKQTLEDLDLPSLARYINSDQ